MVTQQCECNMICQTVDVTCLVHQWISHVDVKSSACQLLYLISVQRHMEMSSGGIGNFVSLLQTIVTITACNVSEEFSNSTIYYL